MRNSTWESWLSEQGTDVRERIALLPRELQRAFAELFEASCDMAQEAYGLIWSQQIDEKVQSSSGSGTTKSVKNPEFSRHLRGRVVRRLDGMRTEIRTMLCFDETPRSAPRFRQ